MEKRTIILDELWKKILICSAEDDIWKTKYSSVEKKNIGDKEKGNKILGKRQRVQCFRCLKYGHYQSECTENVNEKTQKKEIICFNCGQAGHKSINCKNKKKKLNDGLKDLNKRFIEVKDASKN